MWGNKHMWNKEHGEGQKEGILQNNGDPNIAKRESIICVIKKCKESHIQVAEIRLLKAVTGNKRTGSLRNSNTIEELKIDSMFNKIQGTKQNWSEHIARIDDSLLPLKIRKYESVIHGRLGRAMRR